MKANEVIALAADDVVVVAVVTVADATVEDAMVGHGLPRESIGRMITLNQRKRSRKKFQSTSKNLERGLREKRRGLEFRGY